MRDKEILMPPTSMTLSEVLNILAMNLHNELRESAESILACMDRLRELNEFALVDEEIHGP